MGTADYVLRADSVRSHPSGAMILLGLPWYRSLPWASLAGLEVRIDDVEAPVLTVEGQPLDQLGTREDYWFLQKRAEVVVQLSQPLTPDEVLVGVRVDLKVTGPTKPDGSPMDYSAALERLLPVA